MENARSLQKPVIDFDAIPDVFHTAIKVNSVEEVRQVFEDAKSQYHLVNESVYGESMLKSIISRGECVSLESDGEDVWFFRDDLSYYENDGFNILDFPELPMTRDYLCESDFDLIMLVGGV